jgi:hypothetical protein
MRTLFDLHGSISIFIRIANSKVRHANLLD